MDPESQKLLKDTFELAEENNKMLHSMRRSMWMARVMSFLYWILIIGSAIGAFYFLQPYIDRLKVIVDNANNVIENIKP